MIKETKTMLNSAKSYKLFYFLNNLKLYQSFQVVLNV